MSFGLSVELLSGETMLVEAFGGMKIMELKQRIKDMHLWADAVEPIYHRRGGPGERPEGEE